MRSLRRRPEGDRWDPVYPQQATGVPWKPYMHTDDYKLPINLPEPAQTAVREHMVP